MNLKNAGRSRHPLDAGVRWLFGKKEEQWTYYMKATKNFIFRCRKHKQLGTIEVKQIGRMGDDKWHSERAAFENKWEWDEYKKAI